MNDLVEQCKLFCEMYSFADDAKLFRHTLNKNNITQPLTGIKMLCKIGANYGY